MMVDKLVVPRVLPYDGAGVESNLQWSCEQSWDFAQQHARHHLLWPQWDHSQDWKYFARPPKYYNPNQVQTPPHQILEFKLCLDTHLNLKMLAHNIVLA